MRRNSLIIIGLSGVTLVAALALRSATITAQKAEPAAFNGTWTPARIRTDPPRLGPAAVAPRAGAAAEAASRAAAVMAAAAEASPPGPPAGHWASKKKRGSTRC